MSRSQVTRRTAAAALLTCTSLLAAAPATAVMIDRGPASDSSGIDRRAVQRALDAMTASGAQGAQVRITDGRHELQLRSGSADLAGRRPVPRDGRFRIGSVTKIFVATVVLQLVGESKVELDAPVARYLPGLLTGDGAVITVRMLLQHTSGLYDYTDALPSDPAELEAIRFRTWRPEQLIAIATAKPLSFAPGSNFSYSNTNYVIAGMLIEKVTGESYGRAVQQRIVAPLRLRGTSVPGNNTAIPGRHARAYTRVGERVVDITEINPSIASAAGEMISTTADLDRFIDALLDGKLLNRAQLAELTRTVPISKNYGLGIEASTLACGVTIWGHGGGIHGYATLVFSTRDTSKRLELSMTSAPDSGDIRGVDELLDEAFCD